MLPIIRWVVSQHSTRTFEQNWADLQRYPRRPTKLAARVEAALDLHPCDLLIVHRDAEREPAENRIREILEATRDRPMPIVCAVPIRMTEAWLLFDEAAIRRAAGCPNGSMALNLPALKNVEAVSDPKEVLRQTIKVASNLSGRRRAQIHIDIRRLADLIDDFKPLRAISSFRAFEESMCNALRSLGLLRGTDR
ncbi:hypothetical protein [Sorangium sp. So ce1000]|uniref:hypothetical protein n=1 Tax=Sorangium sp. So ce1000 TaxID=3133325 RepID=UPI003F5E83F5